MIKKIALGLIFTLITGVLIVGAANRTAAKTDQYNSAETVAQNGSGGGQNRDSERLYSNQQEQGQGNGRLANTEATIENNQPLGGQGQGNVDGNGQGNGAQKQDADRYGNPEAPTSHDMLTYQGIVLTAPAAGVELVIDTADGALTVGTGPSYWLESSILLAVGDEISIIGYWEEGEFKASTITRSSDNLTVVLRTESGQPLWSGSMRNNNSGQGQGQGSGQGRGQGQGQGNGNQNNAQG